MTIGQPVVDLGVHGDGLVGLELESQGGFDVARGRPLAGSAPGGETQTAADGLQHVSARDDEPSGADSLGGQKDCESVVGVESLATRLLPSARSASPAAALLNAQP